MGGFPVFSKVEVMEIVLNFDRMFLLVSSFSVLSILLTVSAVPAFIIQLPSDYFCKNRKHRIIWRGKHPVIRAILITGKNVAGALLIILGILLLFLPGQGVLTIFAGIMLLDFPGKYRFERYLVERPVVIRSINWVRQKAGKEPICMISIGI